MDGTASTSWLQKASEAIDRLVNQGLIDGSWRTTQISSGEFTADHLGKTQKWRLSGDSLEYEEYCLEPGNEEGWKAGSRGVVAWHENWWKKADECYLEKAWTENGKSWGEKEGRVKTRNWKERWQVEGNSNKTESCNEDGSESWGHIEGSYEGNDWKHEWSTSPALRKTDKWWTENGKKWGIRTEATDTQELIVEWEEQGGVHKERRTVKQPNGDQVIEHEGWGPDFSFKEIYTQGQAVEETVSAGQDNASTWRCIHKVDQSGDFVHNTGSGFASKWDEKWLHSGEMRWAEKSGADENGSWFETWREEGPSKTCSKHGKNAENEWWEEWQETDVYKHCRKEQRFPSITKVQEWEEFLTETEKRSVGKHLENGVEVHSWDWTGPVSEPSKA